MVIRQLLPVFAGPDTHHSLRSPAVTAAVVVSIGLHGALAVWLATKAWTAPAPEAETDEPFNHVMLVPMPRPKPVNQVNPKPQLQIRQGLSVADTAVTPIPATATPTPVRPRSPARSPPSIRLLRQRSSPIRPR